MNISEGLSWLRTMQARREELVRLRDSNARRRITMYDGNKEEEKPEYDPKALDKIIVGLAREIRHCDEAIKRTNATTELKGFDRDEDVLGELV